MLLLVVRADVTVPSDQRFGQNFGDSRAGGLEVMVTLKQVAEYGIVRISEVMVTLKQVAEYGIVRIYHGMVPIKYMVRKSQGLVTLKKEG